MKRNILSNSKFWTDWDAKYACEKNILTTNKYSKCHSAKTYNILLNFLKIIKYKLKINHMNSHSKLAYKITEEKK